MCWESREKCYDQKIMNRHLHLSYTKEEHKLLSDLIELRLVLSKKKQAYDQWGCDQESLFELFCQYRQQLIAHPELWDNEHIYHYLRALPDKDPCIDGPLTKVHVFQYFEGAEVADEDRNYIVEARHAIEQSGGEDRRFFDRYLQPQSETGQGDGRRDLRNTQQYLRCPQPWSYMQTAQYYSAILVNHASELAETLDGEASRPSPWVAESRKQLVQALHTLGIEEASLSKRRIHALSSWIGRFVSKPTPKHYKKLMETIVKLIRYHNRLQHKHSGIDPRKYRDHIVYTMGKRRKVVTGWLALIAVLARAIEHQDLIIEALTPAPPPTPIPYENTSGNGVTYFTSSGPGSFEAQRRKAREEQIPTTLRDREFITGLEEEDINESMYSTNPLIRSLLQRPYTPWSPELIGNRWANSKNLRDAMIPIANGDSLVFIGPWGERETLGYTDFNNGVEEIGRFPFADLDKIHRLLYSDLMIDGLTPREKRKMVMSNIITYPLTWAEGIHSVEWPNQVTIYLDYRLRWQELFHVALHEMLHAYVVKSSNVMIREGKTERLTCVYDWRVRWVEEPPTHYSDLVFADCMTEWLLRPYVQSHNEAYAPLKLETQTIVREKVGRDIGFPALDQNDPNLDFQTRYRLRLLTDNPQHDIHSSSLYFFVSDTNKEKLRDYLQFYREMLAREWRNGNYIRWQFLTPSMVDQLEKIINGDALVADRWGEEAEELMKRYRQVQWRSGDRQNFIDRLVLEGKIFGDEIKIQANTPTNTYVDPKSPYQLKKAEKQWRWLNINLDIDRKREYTLYGLSGIFLVLLLISAIRYERWRRKYKDIDRDGDMAGEYGNHLTYAVNIHATAMIIGLSMRLLAAYAIYDSRQQELDDHKRAIEKTTQDIQRQEVHMREEQTTNDVALRPLKNKHSYHTGEKTKLEKDLNARVWNEGLMLMLAVILATWWIRSGDKRRKKRPKMKDYKVMLPQEWGLDFVQRQKELLWALMQSYQQKNPIRQVLPTDPMQQRNAIQSEAYVHYAQNIGQIRQTPSMGSLVLSKGQADKVIRKADPYDMRIGASWGAVARNVDRKKTARLPRQDEVIVRTYRPMAEETRNSQKTPHFVLYYNLDPLRPHDQQTPQERVAYIVERFLSPLYSLMQWCQETAKRGQASITLKCIRLDHVVYTIYRKPGQGWHNLKVILEDLYRLYFDHFTDTNMIPDIPIDELHKDEQSVADWRVVYRILVLLTGQNDEVNHTVIAQSHYKIKTTRVDWLRDANDLRDAIHDVQTRNVQKWTLR